MLTATGSSVPLLAQTREPPACGSLAAYLELRTLFPMNRSATAPVSGSSSLQDSSGDFPPSIFDGAAQLFSLLGPDIKVNLLTISGGVSNTLEPIYE
jgi:hypothetical protein